VPHATVDTLVDDRAEATEDLGRFLYPFERDVRVDVAAAQEDERAGS
jgi:hypothetical protein